MGADDQNDPDALLEKGIREKTTLFFNIQTKSRPGWGLQSSIVEELQKLNLDVIDHRSWHPRPTSDAVANLVNEVYVKDDNTSSAELTGKDAQQRISDREAEIQNAIARRIGQVDAVVLVQRWFPELSEKSIDDDKSVHEQILDASSKALHTSMREHQQESPQQEPDTYARMDEDSRAHGATLSRRRKQIKHLDAMFKGRLEGLFRRDVLATESENGIELLDTRGVGTGRRAPKERFDVHGYEYWVFIRDSPPGPLAVQVDDSSSTSLLDFEIFGHFEYKKYTDMRILPV